MFGVICMSCNTVHVSVAVSDVGRGRGEGDDVKT